MRLNRGRNLPWSREVGGTAQPGKGLLRRQWRDTWTDKRSVHGSRGTASQAPCCTWMRIGDKDSRDRDPGIGPFAAQLGNGEQTLVESRGHPPSTTHRETTRGGAGKRSGAWIRTRAADPASHRKKKKIIDPHVLCRRRDGRLLRAIVEEKRRTQGGGAGRAGNRWLGIFRVVSALRLSTLGMSPAPAHRPACDSAGLEGR